MNKKQTRTLLTVSCLLAIIIISLLLFRYHSLRPLNVSSTDTPLLIETEPIDHTQSVGGTPTDNPEPTTPQPSSDVPIRESPIVPAPVNKSAAPKQAAIRDSVITEYPYYALLLPNDPYAQSSWALQNTLTPAAWNQTTGSSAIVAVIDSGFAMNHEDLKNQWYQNPGETSTTKLGDRCWNNTPQNKATNNCDDDNNGYVDDVTGWNFVSSTNNPQAGQDNPSGAAVSHGTETAGLAGATSNNNLGIASLNWSTRLMPLQALGDDGAGYTSDVIAAIYYAVDNGAKAINMSLGGSQPDPAMQTAIDYAYDRNVVIIAAAGNCGTGQELGCDASKPGAMSYPALSNHVIAVGATDNTNQRANFSSYGPGLDVVAPGSGNIVSPMWQLGNQTSSYAGSLYGTSFATPFVTSLVSLVKSVRPDASVDDITALIDGSAQKVSAMGSKPYTHQYGHGLINTQSTVAIAAALNASSTTQPLLRQTGNAVSEHSFAPSSNMASGCEVAPESYCTVWFRNETTGYDRYLPYTKANANGLAGWSWTGDLLQSDLWSVRTVQGQNISTTPYLLFSK
ncbi:Thermophilic serine proteinase precursor [compost metagenome]